MPDTPIRSEAVNWSHRLFTLESLVAQIIDAVVKNNANPAIVERTHIQDMPTMSPNVNPVELERALEGTTVPSTKRQVLVPSHGYPVGFLTLITLFLITSDIMYLYTIFLYYRSSLFMYKPS
jgi:hypothetical protein